MSKLVITLDDGQTLSFNAESVDISFNNEDDDQYEGPVVLGYRVDDEVRVNNVPFTVVALSGYLGGTPEITLEQPETGVRISGDAHTIHQMTDNDYVQR